MTPKPPGSRVRTSAAVVDRTSAPILGRTSAPVLVAGAVVLVGASVLVTRNLASRVDAEPARSGVAPGGEIASESPPWGELVVQTVYIEPPSEYVGRVAEPGPTRWTFEGDLDAAGRVLRESGLSPEQAAAALASRAGSAGRDVVLEPPAALVLSLAPDVRSRLYSALARHPANTYIQHPAVFTRRLFDEIFGDGSSDDPATALVRRLQHPRGRVLLFSDYELLMGSLPDPASRVRVVRALARQPGLVVQIRIRPGTDVDRVAAYWTAAPSVRVKDVKPLLEALERNPEGGTLSLMHVLPPFARERVFTFPMVAQEGSVRMDCHWTTMNFFNDVPDDRFADPAWGSQYIRDNFYQIASPEAYGDVILLLDAQGAAVHSCLLVADDIVFTKNGDNHAQPWLLMRLQDVLDRYETVPPLRMAVYRNRQG